MSSVRQGHEVSSEVGGGAGVGPLRRLNPWPVGPDTLQIDGVRIELNRTPADVTRIVWLRETPAP